jgi:hypothetical protein
MRFRSVRVQRLPLFDQVIAIFKKELEPIDVFGALRSAGNIFEHESSTADHEHGGKPALEARD